MLLNIKGFVGNKQQQPLGESCSSIMFTNNCLTGKSTATDPTLFFHTSFTVYVKERAKIRIVFPASLLYEYNVVWQQEGEALVSDLHLSMGIPHQEGIIDHCAILNDSKIKLLTSCCIKSSTSISTTVNIQRKSINQKITVRHLNYWGLLDECNVRSV